MKRIYRLEGGIEYHIGDKDWTSVLWIGDDGKVKYCIDGKKTEFTLEQCHSYYYKSVMDSIDKVSDGVDGVDIVTLAIIVGEERIANNNHQAQTRRHESLDALENYDAALIDDTTDFVAALIRKDDNETLYKAISLLKSDEQELLHKLYLDKHTLTQSEYAKELGISEDSVKKGPCEQGKGLKNCLIIGKTKDYFFFRPLTCVGGRKFFLKFFKKFFKILSTLPLSRDLLVEGLFFITLRYKILFLA